MKKKTYRPGPKPPMHRGPKPADRRFNNKKDKDSHAINDQIQAEKVRLVGDNLTVPQGVYPLVNALSIADDMGLDLIEIAPMADPPVCKIMDYQKFQFQQRKREKEQKAKSSKVVVKEIRFGPQTDEHDYNFKLKHAIGFLQEGAKVKSYVFFKGRSIMFTDQGQLLLLRFAQDLEPYGKLEQMPVLEGKRMTIMISPKKATPKKKESESENTGDTATPEATGDQQDS